MLRLTLVLRSPGATRSFLAAALISQVAAGASAPAPEHGLGALLGLSSMITALAPGEPGEVNFCGTYLKGQTDALYYGDFWSLAPSGEFRYDPAVKLQFRGALYRRDGQRVTVSKPPRADGSAPSLRIELDGRERIRFMEWSEETALRTRVQVTRRVHEFAYEGDRCLPARSQQVAQSFSKDVLVALPDTQLTVRHTLPGCVAVARGLSGRSMESVRSALKQNFNEDVGPDKDLLTSARLHLQSCEQIPGVREALQAAVPKSLRTL